MNAEELKEYKRTWEKAKRLKKLNEPHYCKQCEIRYKPVSNKQKFCCERCRFKFFTNKHRNKYNKLHNPEHKSVFKNECAKRECLKCQQMFMSAGKYNRVCNHCKQGVEFDTGTITHAFHR